MEVHAYYLITRGVAFFSKENELTSDEKHQNLFTHQIVKMLMILIFMQYYDLKSIYIRFLMFHTIQLIEEHFQIVI